MKKWLLLKVHPRLDAKTMPIYDQKYPLGPHITYVTCNVPVNSKTAHAPLAIPGHLTRVKLRTVGNLTQNEARPVGHLTFVSKRLSVVGSKRISQFFDSAREPRSQVIALVDSTWVFLLLSFYIPVVISWNMPLFKTS